METKKTKSVCPECFKEGKVKVIDAKREEEDNAIYLKKTCDKHGDFKSIISNDVEQYEKFQDYWVDSTGVKNGKEVKDGCPHDCGICKDHKSQSVLTNLFVTNRCDLRCSYCFANVGAEGYVYEPSLKQLKKQMLQIRNEKPVGGKALQITGGEPMIRDDILDIIKMAKDVGFTHVQLNTNSIKLSENPDMVKKLREAGCNVLYMSFDGLTEENNPWLEQNKKTIENCRKAGMGIVLVPVVIKGVNDHQLGDIINFALENLDVIRGVNFQPVSFVGKIDKLKDKDRLKQRISFSEVIKNVEEQLDGQLKKEDWYPPSFVRPISKLVESIKGQKQVEFGCSPNCGSATYVFYENGKIIPITDFVDVEGLMEYINKLSKKKGMMKKAKIAGSLMKNIRKYIDKDKSPESFSLSKIITNALTGGNYKDIGKFHKKSLYIGGMWFQDVWNLDLERLERCVIHYSTPEGVIPFCSYNGLNYGQKIRKRNSMSIEEWEEKTGKNLKDDLWKGGRIS